MTELPTRDAIEREFLSAQRWSIDGHHAEASEAHRNAMALVDKVLRDASTVAPDVLDEAWVRRLQTQLRVSGQLADMQRLGELHRLALRGFVRPASSHASKGGGE